MARNPFDFLDAGTKERTLLMIVLALIKRSGGELELKLEDLTSISDGDGFMKHPSDTNTSLVLRFARRGAEVFFLTEEPSTPVKSRSTARMPIALPAPVDAEVSTPSPIRRHSLHDDLDLALREEDMARAQAAAQKQRMTEARAASGALPWRTVRTQ